MTNSKTSLDLAEQAYDYAFTLNRSAPQWWRFRWDTLQTLLTNGIAKVAYIIPIAGYIILYSDYFHSLFAYPKAFSTGFLNIEQRATLAYIGAIFLLLAYGLYFSGCPWLIRGKRNVHQFVGDILSTNYYATVQKVLEVSETYLNPIDVNLFP